MTKAEITGLTIGYDEAGAGLPLVLIHGHPFDRSMWRPQLEHFCKTGFRVIAPDLRGYGESTVVPGKTTLDAFAHDLAALLDQLGVEQAVLGGLSMGGQIVMEFHRLFPHRVRGLLLADTSAAAESEHGRKARNDLADRLLRTGMTSYAEELLPWMLSGNNIQNQPELTDHVLGMMRGASAAGTAAALRGRAERPDYLGMLPHVAVATLVIVGSEDELTPVGDAQILRDRIPHATLDIIQGAAHLPNLERPTEFNTALQQFLGDLTAGGAEKESTL